MHTRSSMPTVTWIGIGIGSAALAFGTTSGIVAYARLKKADCGSDNKCSHEVYGQQGASYNAWRKASTIGFMVGGVSAAFVGITWLAVNPKQNGGEQIGVTVGPSGLAMEGTF